MQSFQFITWNDVGMLIIQSDRIYAIKSTSLNEHHADGDDFKCDRYNIGINIHKTKTEFLFWMSKRIWCTAEPCNDSDMACAYQ